jgi:hypothetical protein
MAVFAVVVTVTVTFPGVVPLSDMLLGLIVHVAPTGTPEQLSVSVPLAPFGVNVKL